MSSWKIVREANDPLATRLSIGSPHMGTIDDGYIVYRGETTDAIEILQRAIKELKQHLKEQGE